MDTVKLVIVGQENVGKSFLTSCVKQSILSGKKKCKHTIPLPTTKGIDRDQLSSGSSVRLNTLDFAGNEAYYPMHSYFLSEKSVYFVVWNVNAPHKSSRVEHWVRTIHFYAPKSAIFLIGTHRDTLSSKATKQLSEGVKEKLFSQFSKLSDSKLTGVHFVSSVTGKGIKKLVHDLVDTINNLSYIQNSIPAEVANLDKVLTQYCEVRKQVPIIQWPTLLEFSRKCNVQDAKAIPIVRFLELTGSIFYFPGKEAIGYENIGKVPVEKMKEEDGIIILNATFLTELFDAIIETCRSEAVDGIVASRVLKQSVLSHLAGPLQNYIVKLLELFEFITVLPNEDILVPCFLPNTPLIQDIWPTFDPTKIHFFRDYIIHFSPYGIFSRLVVRLLQLPYTHTYWRYGIVLTSDDGSCLVSYDIETSRIRLTARGVVEHDIVGLFCNILRIVDALFDDHFQVTPEVEIPCTSCLLSSEKSPTFFTKTDCEAAIVNQQCMECTKSSTKALHRLLVHQIAPDVAMRDFKSKIISFSNVTILEEIGQGAFATVYKGQYQGKVVAVKKLSINFETPGSGDKKEVFKELQEFRREVRAMTKLQHPNLVNLIAFSVGEVLSLVCELMEQGNLYDFIHKQQYDWETIYRMSWDIASGLSYLHSVTPPLVHRDLKSPNVLLAATSALHVGPVAKIADFGLTRELVTESFAPQTSRNRDVANPTWLAPEVIKGEAHGVSSDIYPLGIIMWELYSRKHPFENYPFVIDMEEDIVKGVRPPVFNDCPPEFTALMARCWAANPSVRPSASEVVEKLHAIIATSTPALVTVLQEHKRLYFGNADKILTRREKGELSLARTDAVEPSSPNKKSLARSDHSEQALAKKSRVVVELEASKPVLEFKKGASSNLVNIWKGDVAPTVLEGHSTKKNPVRRIDQQLFVIPFPESPDDVARGLKGIVKDSECTSYRIYSLTNTPYNYTAFEGSVLVYDLDPELPPQISEILPIVKHIQEWTATPGQLAFVHCNGEAPVNTALVVGCVLAKRGKQLSVALQAFETIVEGQANNYPSWKRYLEYFYKHRKNLSSDNKPPDRQTMYLHKLRFNSIPSFSLSSTCHPVFSVSQNGRKVFFSKDLKGKKEKDTVEFFTRELRIANDVKIEFYHGSTTHRMFSLAFNIAYETVDSRGRLSFKKSELDRACLDTAHQNFRNNFSLEVFLLSEEVQQEMKRGTLSTSEKPAALQRYLSSEAGKQATSNRGATELTRSLTTPASPGGKTTKIVGPSTSPTPGGFGARSRPATNDTPSDNAVVSPATTASTAPTPGNAMTSSSPTSTTPPSGSNAGTASFFRRSAVHRPSSADMTSTARNLQRGETFKARPMSLALPKHMQGKRELIVPPKPPPAPTPRRNYFSFQREITGPDLTGVIPSIPVPTPPARSTSLNPSPATPLPNLPLAPLPPGPLCPICDKSLGSGFTIEIFVGTTIHVECMKCGTCGRALQGDNDQSILQDGRITCPSCAKDLFPSCKICNKQIRKEVVKTPTGESYHKSCFLCCECSADLTSQPYCAHNRLAYCHPCAYEKGIQTPTQESAPSPPTPEELELTNILKTDLQKKHFHSFLQKKGIESMLCFYEDVKLRKGLSLAEREESSGDIQQRYLNEKGINKLPDEIRKKVLHLHQKSLNQQHHNNSSKYLFKNAQAAVFLEMSKHVREFTKSTQFTDFLTDLGERPDEEEEEEDLRRTRIAKFIPIVPSDLPLIQVKREPEPTEEELRLIKEEEEMLAKEEEELRKKEEEEQRLRDEEQRSRDEEERRRRDEEQRRRDEEERRRRGEEQKKKDEEEQRRLEEDRKKLEDQKKLQAIRDSEARIAEEQRKIQAQREADARYLEAKMREHEAALQKVRAAQLRAQEASEKAKEVSRQNEAIMKQLAPQRPTSLPTQEATTCLSCKRTVFPPEPAMKNLGVVIHNTCFVALKCHACRRALKVDDLGFSVDSQKNVFCPRCKPQ